MARAEIIAGICEFTAIVETKMNGDRCQISIESDCNAINMLASQLVDVDPLNEISARRSMPEILKA